MGALTMISHFFFSSLIGASKIDFKEDPQIDGTEAVEPWKLQTKTLEDRMDKYYEGENLEIPKFPEVDEFKGFVSKLLAFQRDVSTICNLVAPQSEWKVEKQPNTYKLLEDGFEIFADKSTITKFFNDKVDAMLVLYSKTLKECQETLESFSADNLTQCRKMQNEQIEKKNKETQRRLEKKRMPPSLLKTMKALGDKMN